MILMESYYYLFSISFGYVLFPHVVHKGIQENKCGGDTPRQQDEIQSQKSRNSESNGSRTMSNEAGLEQPLEQAAWPPLWTGQPIIALPRLVLHPWSGLSPIHSIFICFAFCFEPD